MTTTTIFFLLSLTLKNDCKLRQQLWLDVYLFSLDYFCPPSLKIARMFKIVSWTFSKQKKNFSFLCLYNAFSDKVGLKSQAVILLKKFKFHTRRVKKESCNKLNSIKYICKLQIQQLLWVLFCNKLQLSSWLLNCPIQLRWKVLLVDLFTS